MKALLFFVFILLSNASFGQYILDSCFSSTNIGESFISSTLLANNSAPESDLLEWTGDSWGVFNINIPPPGNVEGSRAIWMGYNLWTTGGEGFCLLLSAPLVTGETYSFDFTYVSEGYGSDGNFAPFFYTNNVPTIDGAYNVGNLMPAGYTWVENTFTFTATESQNGHTWIALHTGLTGSSGMIHSFCDVPEITCFVNFGEDTTLCQGETLVLNAEIYNANNYVWQDSSSNLTFNVTQEGTYWVEVSSYNCIATDTIVVTSVLLPSVNLGSDTILCQGESLLLDATNPNASNYLWQDSSTYSTFNALEQGSYWVEVTENYCSNIDSINVSIFQSPLINLGNDTIICQGESLLLNPTNAVVNSYLWQDNSTDTSFVVSDQGLYWVEVTDENCSTRDTINVVYPLAIDFGNDTTICQGSTILLDATTSFASSYLWQDNSTNPTLNVLQQGVYWVEITVSNCILTNSVIIDIEDCEIILELPNVFTPNNDGVNDLFVPVITKGIVDMNTIIFNRWGKKVFETDKLEIGWNGLDISDGVYFWLVNYTDKYGIQNNLSGYVKVLIDQ